MIASAMSEGFLCASKYGAREITALDISLEAIEQVKRNAIINGYANINAVQTDVFEEMRKYKKEQRKFDVIILDPRFYQI